MFLVIEEGIQKLTRVFTILDIFNTEEEAQFLVDLTLKRDGGYQNRCGYYYDCFVIECETDFAVENDKDYYIIVESGYSDLVGLCDFVCVKDVLETIEETRGLAQEEHAIFFRKNMESFVVAKSPVK